jgi:hypothetical protein
MVDDTVASVARDVERSSRYFAEGFQTLTPKRKFHIMEGTASPRSS